MGHDSIDTLQQDWTAQRPDLDNRSMGVVLRIQALARIFTEQATEKLESYDLQWWQYDVLSALRRQGEPYEMAATELADDNMLTSGAMTNRINRLQQAGLVKRKQDPHDRRRVIVRLSTNGLELVEAAAEARFDSAMKAMESLDRTEQEALSKLLRKVLLAQEDNSTNGDY